MKCKYCEAELEEGSSVCPACGMDNTPEETATSPELDSDAERDLQTTAEFQEDQPAEDVPQEDSSVEIPEAQALEESPRPAGKGKVILAISLCVILLAALVAIIAVGVNGGLTPRENDIYYKESYNAEDSKLVRQADKVVATMGGKELTNGELQVFYWMQVYDFLDYYGQYAVYYGLDYTQPLDTQVFNESTGMTWQQYFLQAALENWQRYQALALEAENAGVELKPDFAEYLNTLPDEMKKTAEENNFGSAEEMLAHDMGAGCSLDDYANYMRLTYYGYQYFSGEYEKLTATPADVEAYFAENEAYFSENGVTRDSGSFVDVRHILICPEGGTEDEDGNVTYSDEEWEACRAKAQALLEQWLEGEASEDSFAELAKVYTEDEYSRESGGLYTQVYEGEMVEPFEDWCFDETRQTGDYGLVQTTYGYHIMYFLDSVDIWYYYAENSLMSDQANQLIEAAMEKYPMVVSYKNIVLGNVDMGG